MSDKENLQKDFYNYISRLNDFKDEGFSLVDRIGKLDINCFRENNNLCVDRKKSALDERFGYGLNTTGGSVETEITNLNDSSLWDALQDDVSRWITFPDGMIGTWNVPNGTGLDIAPNKTVDGRCADITWQFGYPNNNLSINSNPVITPEKTGQFGLTNGNFFMTDITLKGDLGWPYKYESPFFSNGATDGFEIWDGENYFFNHITISRMSDESIGVFQNNGGSPTGITFGNIKFIETKTGSLLGRIGNHPKGKITVALNEYNEMVNGRSPGEVRNMDAHVYNNVIRYMNDEGYKVGTGGRVVSQYNLFDMSCSPGISGPRTVREVRPNETPAGILWSEGDIIDSVTASCPFTTDSGFIGPPSAMPFTPSYSYNLIKNRSDIEAYVALNSGKRDSCPKFC